MANSRLSEKQLLKDVFGRTGQCPPQEVLARVAESDSESGAGAEARAHLETCVRCQNELSLMREFLVATPRPEEVESAGWIESELRRRAPEVWTTASQPVPERQSIWEGLGARIAHAFPSSRWRAVTVACAALLIVATAGIYFRHGAEPALPTQPGSSIVWRSQQFELVSPVGDISRVPAEFHWQPVEGAAMYQVRLLEVDRNQIWSAESDSTKVPVPSGIRAQMAPGRTFLWEVTARNAAGEKIAGTDLQRFHMMLTTR